MFDHVELRVSDLAASARRYGALLDALGVERRSADAELVEWANGFDLSQATAERPATRNLHVAFVAGDRDAAAWRDPDGNGVDAVHAEGDRAPGQVDHVRLGVADLPAARDFYAAIAPYARIRLDDDTPGRVRFRFPDGSFSLVAGTATEHAHLAFGTDDDGAVQGFHATATALGYRDNGGPGERPEYHPGYYAAFVLDPDGNNIELVNHHR